ncbi:zinc ribbon domain-containing protein [soil metagenome]
MPLYEYYCTDCHNTFDALRAMDKADATIQCKSCEGRHTSRVLSIFAARPKAEQNKKVPTTVTVGGGGGCCGGSCGCH